MLSVAVLTRQGSDRAINQDRVVVNDTVVDAELSTTAVFTVERPSLVAVLDGLGGHPAGDIAAFLAAEVMADASWRIEDEQDLISVVEEANRFLYRVMSSHPILRFMGTTIAGAFIAQDSVTVFHVGDSRVYLHAGGHLRQVTSDDWDSGYITQTLGGCDSFEPISVHTGAERLGEARILAATDGLFGLAEDDALASAMNGPLEGVPEQLREVAVESGNTDDFSVAVAEATTPRR